MSSAGARCREPLQEPRACQRPQLTTQWLGRGDQEVSQLTEPGPLGVDRPLARSGQRLQRLALTAGTWCCRPLAGEHTAGGADRVKRVGLAARAPLPAQSANLEHPLTAPAEEAGQPATERAGAFDRERAPSVRVLLGKLERARVAVAARRNIRLKDDCAGDDLDDRQRVRVAVRVNTDDVVQLICEHPTTNLQHTLGDTNRCRSGDGNRGRQNCDGSRAQNADRLLIRPASGRQAGTGLSARTHH